MISAVQDNFSNTALAAAQVIWDFMHMGQELRRVDCIVAGGSHDLRVAERAAELFLEGWAPWLVLSGGLGRHTLEVGGEPEADRFAAMARRMGVPDTCMIIENRSTNTGENAELSWQALQARGLAPGSAMIVHKPYMERRAYATFRKRWPTCEICVTSPQLPLTGYPTETLSLSDVIHIMVGDFQRMPIYAAKGYQ
ncbi:MAG: YdcF family protein, partial [Verrucomicrobia bacterium]|nr:YdcF family protein [Verrucomicrobiota bacterium]